RSAAQAAWSATQSAKRDRSTQAITLLSCFMSISGSVAHQPLDGIGFVVHRKAVDHRRAGCVQADDIHLSAVTAKLHDHLVERAHGGDVPEMRAADIDAHLLDDFLEIEGRNEAIGRGKE